MKAIKVSKCKGCKKDIIWAETSDSGKKIPLDPRPAVYWVEEVVDDITEDKWVCATRQPGAYVTHFATCPNANEFSGGKK